MKKILISDRVHPSLPERLKKAGFSVTYAPGIELSEVHRIIRDFQGIVINSKIRMFRNLIDEGIQLEFIARLGSGMEIVDIPYARKRGIRVINAPEGNSNAVGEHAIGMLLALANHLVRCHTEVKNYLWNREKNRGWELKGKTIGIIGVGHTGRSLAEKLEGWGMQVLGYDKYVQGYGKELGYIEEVTLKEIQEHADIISFHLPLTQETVHYCDREFLDNCREGIILINTSRGVVIKTEDLVHALHSGKVSGACLDVFENENPDTYSTEEKKLYARLFAFDNVITSPHVAGWTRESLRGIADLVYNRIISGYTMEP